MSDDPIEPDDPDVEIDPATGTLSYRGEPYSGAVTQSYPDGTWREYWSYDAGERDGDWTGWYPDGTMRYNGEFYRNRPVGTWQEWYPDGARRLEDVYDIDGVLLTHSVWDPAGELVEYSDERTRKGVAATAVPAEELRWDDEEQRRYRGDEPFTGQEFRRAAPSSPITEVAGYTDGYPDGPVRGWYLDGTPRYTGEYADRRQVGTWREWFPTGARKEETVFAPDGALLTRRLWDETGALIAQYDRSRD
ncbi:toxin-antitoxin system YwqK family antitoxin [Nocardia sp. NPDC056064]|uniref:toxin-antitoxin system YwqK family antitoxin n=1 Tax=Nocardia sp. NPDC056064 TaxID=3345701 RepID=UPI0035E31227